MQLIYTPRSHFSRKVRILLAALDVEVELIDAGNVADARPAAYGPNPLMKVPTLLDGTISVFDSDHIAAYLVRMLDPADRFGVLTTDAEMLNARAVMNGVMAAEVELILAARTGLDTRAHRRFDKLRESIQQGLAWLEARSDRFPREPAYLAFHAVAMWDHLELYQVVELGFPGLRSYAMQWASTPFIAQSKPA
ncbi:MAG: glutathione S-transferase N-terminal domain-containing protein [Steroidobacteraceae bacterium]